MTIKQIQHLLAYLGYYVGSIDGVWGAGSKTACKAFQQDFGGIQVDGIAGTETQKALKHAVAYGIEKITTEDSTVADAENTTTTGTFWDEIQYFKQSEFACKCGCGACDMEEQLIRAADTMRKDMGNPIVISSGRRCATHNASAAVGGVFNSRHLTGKAMDFSVSGATNATVEAYLTKLKAAGTIRYWYNITGGWFHMDIL